MKKTILLLVPLAVLALLAWILLLPSASENAEPAPNHPSANASSPVEAPTASETLAPESANETRSVAEVPTVPIVESVAVFDRNAVYGIVSDNAGKPVVGASIALYEDGWEGWDEGDSKSMLKPRHETKSGEDGRFKIEGLTPFESFRLLTKASGFGASVRHGAKPGKDLKITLMQESFLAGEVRDLQNKQPVSGAKLSYRHQGLYEAQTLSDANGKFRLPVSPREQVSILVTADGYMRQRFPVSLQPGESKERDLGLRKGGELAGEVYDLETNQPVVGAEIEIWGQTVGRSDENGRFRIQAVETTNNAVSVHAPGYCSLRQDLSLATTGDWHLPLLRGVEIEGVVRDRAGKPVAGASLEPSLEEGEEDVFFSGNKGQVVSSSYFNGRHGRPSHIGKYKAPRGASWENSNRSRTQKSDAQGKFHLDGLMPSAQAFSVGATHPNFCAGSQKGLKLTEAGQKAFAEIVLSRGASIEGRVLMGEKPVIAGVWLTSEETWLQSETNDGGEYGFQHLAEGSYKIGANPEGMQDFSDEGGESLQLSEGGVHRKDLRIEGGVSRPISGRVLSSDGKPIANARLNAWANTEDGRFVNREGKSLADGSFRMDLPEMGSALFQVSAWDGTNWASQSKIAPGADNVEIRFPVQGKLRLRVLEARTGDPVPTFQVYFRDAAGKRNRSMSLTTDANGLAECDIALGLYDLTIMASPQGFRNVQIPAVEISQKPSDPLRIDLLPGVKVTIKVTGEEGVAFTDSSHWISVTPITGGPSPKMFVGNQGSYLDESGQCTIPGLTPGKFRVKINPADVLLEPGEITVPDEDTASFEIHGKPKPPEEKPKGE